MSSSSSKVALESAQDIFDFFGENQAPLFYVSSTAYNILGSDAWIGNLSFVNSIDSFSGQHPRIFTAIPEPGIAPRTIEASNNFLLAQPSVVEHVRRAGPGAGVLFLMFDEHTEALAQGLGLKIAHPPAKLHRHLDSKITTTRLADRAGIRSVPNVLAAVKSYRALLEVGDGLGPDLVVQLPHGHSGATTFFISSEDDYRIHAERIAAHAEVKVMKRIRCRQTTIEGCVTRRGTLAGPLMTEMVGYPELTPFAGGWCGNEVFASEASDLISTDVRRQASRAVIAMGEQLREVGYAGYFGLDLLLDQDSGALYLGEMNPRLTGATLLTSQASLDHRQPPLLLFHLLEYFGIDYSFNIEQFNELWIEPGPAMNWSQLILDHVEPEPAKITQAPPSGVWHIDADGTPCFSRTAFQMQAPAGESEAFLMRTIDVGATIWKGACAGRLIARGRLMDDGYRLSERAAAWIRGFRKLFHSIPDLPSSSNSTE